MNPGHTQCAPDRFFEHNSQQVTITPPSPLPPPPPLSLNDPHALGEGTGYIIMKVLRCVGTPSPDTATSSK